MLSVLYCSGLIWWRWRWKKWRSSCFRRGNETTEVKKKKKEGKNWPEWMTLMHDWKEASE